MNAAEELKFATLFLHQLASRPVKFAQTYCPHVSTIKRVLPEASRPYPLRDPNSTPASAQQITITIKPLKGGNPFPLTVTPLQPIDEIKTLIATQCGVPASAQRLVFNGKGLTDGKTLLDYEIPTGATLNLLQKPGSAARPSKASTIDAAAPMPAAAGVKRKEDGPALKENNVGETNNFVVAAKKKATDAAFWGDLRNVLRGHFADGSHLDKVFNNFTQSYQALCGDLGPEERVAFQKASAQS